MPDQIKPNKPLLLLPFPLLNWEEGYAWEGTAVLDAWAGFQSRQGPDASLDSVASSDGSVTLTVKTPDNEQSIPSAEQATAYHLLVEQQEAVRDAVLRAILEAYPGWQELYGYDAEEAEQLMPTVEHFEQFKPLIGLSSVHLLSETRNSVAYIGLEFGCTWDDEHGLGVMTHAGRIVEVGQADTAFLGWIATKDAEETA